MSNESNGCCAGDSVSRRAVMRGIGGAGASAAVAASMPVMAGPFAQPSATGGYRIPADKKLSASWLRALTARGTPTTYRGWPELQFIGMPIGGIATGTVYLGGDGTLWCWDIFNDAHDGVVPNPGVEGYVSPNGKPLTARDGANFVDPPIQQSPWHFEQGFAVSVIEGGRQTRRAFNKTGFADIAFTGHPPIASVEYRDPATALTALLEAMTPYVPLDADESGYPATILRYTLSNTGDSSIEIEMQGWLQNPVLRSISEDTAVRPVNRSIRAPGWEGFIAEIDGARSVQVNDAPDCGSLALIALDSDAVVKPEDADGSKLFSAVRVASANDRPVGTITSRAILQPGESRHFDYVLGWFFPNSKIKIPLVRGDRASAPATRRRWYATRFANAAEVVGRVAEKIDSLRADTRAWRDAWYGGTLPHWLLERAIIPANTLQTSNCLRFDDGRFWAWEGIGCCAGTCTHVWHYAQSSAHLFPALEREVRERTDLGIALLPSGEIAFRGEFDTGGEGGDAAVDGQAGVILRTLREHRMTGDNQFLGRVYPGAKKALQFLIGMDGRDGIPDGILTGAQHNTLDAAWFGKVPNLSSLYLAALRAGQVLATDAGDDAFAEQCSAIADRGYRSLRQLYRPQFGYFVQEEDPKHIQEIGIGIGCYIDQVIGQWWAHQLGLGRLVDGDAVRSALNKLWTNNFAPDVGQLRTSIECPSLKGRPYSLAGDAGLIMCTWPHGGRSDDWQSHWQYGYFNETMTGFEYQAAAHMIWESREDPALLLKGLAVARAIHDRYAGPLRNPYNEIECSDHYARAMSSHSLLMALSGFEFDGPRRHIGFKPRLSANGRFAAPFTAAEGWGTFEEVSTNDQVEARLKIVRGRLQLRTVGLQVPPNSVVQRVTVAGGGAIFEVDRRDILIKFNREIAVKPESDLVITTEIRRNQ